MCFVVPLGFLWWNTRYQQFWALQSLASLHFLLRSCILPHTRYSTCLWILSCLRSTLLHIPNYVTTMGGEDALYMLSYRCLHYRGLNSVSRRRWGVGSAEIDEGSLSGMHLVRWPFHWYGLSHCDPFLCQSCHCYVLTVKPYLSPIFVRILDK